MKVLACMEYDAATGQCMQEAWVEQPSLLPPLTPEQGSQIGWSIMLMWVSIACLVMLARKAA
jgi:hypothetical protein